MNDLRGPRFWGPLAVAGVYLLGMLAVAAIVCDSVRWPW